MSEAVAFRDRFAVERFGADGILIDLVTGNYFQLNATATKVCVALQGASSTADAARQVSAAMAVGIAEATALVEAVRADIETTSVERAVVGPFRYQRASGGYRLEENGTTVLTIDGDGRSIRLEIDPAGLPFRMLDYIRAVTPKLLYLRGVTVLHASACVLPDGLTAFSGASGAGKTTTARAFAEAGTSLIAEDLLVLSPEHSHPTLILDGERHAHAWAAEAAERLTTKPGATIDCEPLTSIASSAANQPLDAIWFVDRSRRHGDSIQLKPLSVLDGALALMSHNFLGADDPERWRRHTRQCYGIAGFLRRSELTAPDGVDRLTAAARAYATKTAS